jgi:hypothetical protein
MSTVAVPLAPQGRTPLQRWFLAGSALALLDIAYAWVNWVLIQKVITTEQLFHSISAGLLGREAASAGGTKTAVLGAILHVVIAFLWTTGFFLAVRASTTLRRWLSTTSGAVLVGLAFGVVVYLGMNFVVVPFSRTGRGMPHMTVAFFVNLVQHMVMVGLPVALIIRDGGER